MEIIKNNIANFKDTRKRSRDQYLEETKTLIKNTIVWEGAEKLIPREVDSQEIEFVNDYSVSTGIREASKGYHVAVLSFADALEVGGMVMQGAVTQEESICRATNLYETLIQDKCIEDYYMHNAELCNDVYSSRLIYAKDVLVFKGDDGVLLNTPLNFDVITIPFPLGYVASYDIYLERIKCILNIANSYRVDSLVLGAIGCGVFGNPVSEVAKAFAEVLSEHNYCNHIIFAIKSSEEDTSDNYSVFKEEFYKWYREG